MYSTVDSPERVKTQSESGTFTHSVTLKISDLRSNVLKDVLFHSLDCFGLQMQKQSYGREVKVV